MPRLIMSSDRKEPKVRRINGEEGNLREDRLNQKEGLPGLDDLLSIKAANISSGISNCTAVNCHKLILKSA